MNATWTNQDWTEWALGDLRADGEKPRGTPLLADRWHLQKGVPWQVIAGALVFAVLAALYALMPLRLPGELQDADLVKRAGPPCTTCPPSGEITGVGLLQAGEIAFVTVRLAAPPSGTRLRVDVPDEASVWLQQVAGTGRWQASRQASSQAATTSPLRIGTRADRIVVEMRAARIPGVAVATDSGDRVPSTGFVAPVRLPPVRFNLVDAIVLALLMATAWAGYRRGCVLGTVDLAGLTFVLLLTWVLYEPLGRLMRAAATSQHESDALAFGLLVAVIGVGAHVLARAVAPSLLHRAGQLFDRVLGPRLNGPLGVPIAVARTLALVAMALAVAGDLVVLGWAQHAVQASVSGPPLVHAWRAMFPGI
jgi:uncharacterized membrane protein required for colicin V production